MGLFDFFNRSTTISFVLNSPDLVRCAQCIQITLQQADDKIANVGPLRKEDYVSIGSSILVCAKEYSGLPSEKPAVVSVKLHDAKLISIARGVKQFLEAADVDKRPAVSAQRTLKLLGNALMREFRQ